MAANHFYSDQPELALRYYRRLLQMGVSNAQLWTNLGLCCFYASQYDITLSCFDKARGPVHTMCPTPSLSIHVHSVYAIRVTPLRSSGA